MKKIFILLIILKMLGPASKAQPSLSSAPTSTRNYVMVYTCRTEGLRNFALLNDKSVAEVQQTINYIDGIGRLIQTVQTKGSVGYNDIVQPVAYEANTGRQTRTYLPYTSTNNNGSYKADALTPGGGVFNFYNPPGSSGSQQSNGVVRTLNPFSETVFEKSPLERVVEQGSTGENWQISGGHTLKTVYLINANDQVLRWTVTGTGAGSTQNGGADYYEDGVLFKTVLKDENWVSGLSGTTEEFKDKQGRIVLKRVWESENSALSTYYVYDDSGNLRYVIPPGFSGASFTESDQDFLRFIYAYKYDQRNRMVEKKIPGKNDWEYFVYNKLDKVIATQDPRQRLDNEWLITKYDVFGRVVETGVYSSSSSRSTLQSSADAITTLWDSRGSTATYSNNAFPAAAFTRLTANFYDDYTFGPLSAFASHSYHLTKTDRTRGLLTGSIVRVLGTSADLATVNYYDDKGRLIQKRSQNNLGGLDILDFKYSFVGELTNSTRIHSSASATVTIINRYVYDHMGRQSQVYQKTGDSNSTEVLLSEFVYNELGQLKEKKLHDGLQSTSYTYNARGWLKTQTSPQFSMELKYEDGSTPQWNGNIANQLWGTAAPDLNTFTYNYDKLNRLISGAATGMSETMSYDVMGNITSLDRDGEAHTYSYTGNRLIQVSGFTSADYQYDDNGNVTYDARNDKTLSYNLLNLPQTVSGGTSYLYDASGAKLRKVSVNPANITTTTDYISGIEYENGQITIIHTEEGIARRSGSSYRYEYNLKDHLGNVRVTFYRNPNTGNTEVIQRDDYYAFGKRKVVQGGTNKYLYNGNEIQDELGGQYDYGARFYDPVIGRWNVVDPLAEQYRRWSPYVYTMDNPVRFIDPDGMSVATFSDKASILGLLNWAKSASSINNADDWYKRANGEETQEEQDENNFWKSSSFFAQKGNFSGKTAGVDQVGSLIALMYMRANKGGGSLWDDFVSGIPGIGPAKTSGDKLAAGNYWGAAADFSMALFDVFTLGAGSEIKTLGNGIKFLGLGSTGRNAAVNLTEQLTMQEIISNPNLGKTVMTGMQDSRWLGWNKMQYTHTALDGTKTTVHYVAKFENGVLKFVDDFKFK